MVGSFKELESPFDPKGNTFYEFMTQRGGLAPVPDKSSDSVAGVQKFVDDSRSDPAGRPGKRDADHLEVLF